MEYLQIKKTTRMIHLSELNQKKYVGHSRC